MMTGNIPSFHHTQSSLPNSREDRGGGVYGREAEWRQIERDEMWSETKTDRGGKRKMKRRQSDEMSMLIQLYHNCVLRSNEHIYNVPVILHQQLQYIYICHFYQSCSQTDISGPIVSKNIIPE